jgi:outer membrane biosynthesis protein TonB
MTLNDQIGALVLKNTRINPVNQTAYKNAFLLLSSTRALNELVSNTKPSDRARKEGIEDDAAYLKTPSGAKSDRTDPDAPDPKAPKPKARKKSAPKTDATPSQKPKATPKKTAPVPAPKKAAPAPAPKKAAPAPAPKKATKKEKDFAESVKKARASTAKKVAGDTIKKGTNKVVAGILSDNKKATTPAPTTKKATTPAPTTKKGALRKSNAGRKAGGTNAPKDTDPMGKKQGVPRPLVDQSLYVRR